MKKTPNIGRAVFSEANENDMSELSEKMRSSDRVETALMNGMSPEQAVRISVLCSDVALSARIDGRLFCVFGAMNVSLVEAEAVAWMLCTEEPGRRPREFLMNCREGFRVLASRLPDVETFSNLVHVKNASAVRWLKWSGAWFETSTEFRGQFGGTFKRFSIDSKDAGRKD